MAQFIIEEQWQLRWLMLVRGGVEPKNSWLACLLACLHSKHWSAVKDARARKVQAMSYKTGRGAPFMFGTGAEVAMLGTSRSRSPLRHVCERERR
jgi:transposase